MDENPFTTKARKSTGPLARSLVSLSRYCKVGLVTLLPTHQGIALQDHTPALGGGVQPFFLLSLLWSRPPSLFLVAKRLGAQSLSLLLLLLFFPLLQLLCCFLSCPTNSQPLINEIVEAARLLPAPFLPLLSSPLQRHCGFSNVLPLSPGRRGVLF